MKIIIFNGPEEHFFTIVDQIDFLLFEKSLKNWNAEPLWQYLVRFHPNLASMTCIHHDPYANQSIYAYKNRICRGMQEYETNEWIHPVHIDLRKIFASNGECIRTNME